MTRFQTINYQLRAKPFFLLNLDHEFIISQKRLTQIIEALSCFSLFIGIAIWLFIFSF